MVIKWNELRDARERKGLTQEQLGEALGVSTRTITNWEATGVPKKAEYKVERYFGDDLSAVRDSPTTRMEHDRLLEEMLSGIDLRLTGSAAAGRAPSRLEMVRLLDRLPKSTILEYLTMRTLREEARNVAAPAVATPGEDDPHTVDLSSDFDLAATEDDTLIDPDRGA